MSVYAARILGCGSSGGVPRIDGDWGKCDPNNPKNRRTRCSLLVEKAPSIEAINAGDVTRVVIDTSPDFRQQMLDAGAPNLNGLVFTHTHADQAHGIDDVRAIVYRNRTKLDTAMSPETYQELLERFRYIFETPKGSGYPPLLEPRIVQTSHKTQFDGAGGGLDVELFDVEHGGAPCSGVRIGPIVYTPDVSGLNNDAKQSIAQCGVWIVDALRETPHPSHAHLALTLNWIEELSPKHAILTNLHVDMDYQALLTQLSDRIRPAFDGLSFVYNDEDHLLVRADPI